MTFDVAIIGAGISGLTTAWELSRAGYNVVVLERQQHVGGSAVSENINGFLMEHGPTTLNAMVPQALALSDHLGLQNAKLDLGDGVKKRYLLDKGKLHGISIHPAGFLLSPYLSIRGRFAILTEILKKPKIDGKDETVYAFAARRFGPEFANKVMDPLVAGMFAGDAKATSLNAAFSKLKTMEQRYGSITRSVIAAKPDSEPGKRLFSFRRGVATLPKALAGQLQGKIKTGVAVATIEKTATGFNIATAGAGKLSAKAVVLAVQPHVVSGLLQNLDTCASEAAASMDAPPMSVVFHGYHRKQVSHPLDSLGVLSVAGQPGIITGIQFQSTMFENRAPDGMVSIAAYVGGTRNRAAAQLPADQLSAMVHDQLSSLLGIKGKPVISRTRQWARSLPQYEMGHREKVEILKSLNQRLPGLYLTGNYLAGVSMANCIAQAQATAIEVMKQLGKSGKRSETIDHWQSDARLAR